MGELAKAPNYQVKVDNWSIFFLQRLHHFFRKDYHCDLTLKFSNLNGVRSVKVHRLVLHACTDYFESLEVIKDSELGECLQLTEEMHPDVVIPIISFMYTGKLEFPASLQSRLYEAASKLRMSILTKLLDAQPKQSLLGTPSSDDGLTKQSAFPCNVLDDVKNVDASQQWQDSPTPGVQVVQIMSNMSVSSPSRQVEDPVVTLTPVTVSPSLKTPAKGGDSATSSAAVLPTRAGNVETVKGNNAIVKTKAFKKEIGSVSSESTVKPKVVDVSLPPTLPGRKLPIWKRKVPLTGSHVVSDSKPEVAGTERIFPEAPKPTRFEWDEDLNDPTVLRPVEEAFRVLAHDVSTEIQHPVVLDGEPAPRPIRPKDTSHSTSGNHHSPGDSGKRSSPASPNSPDSSPFKRSRTDLQDMKEYGKQQQLRNEILCSEENSEDGMDPDDLYGSCDDEPQDISCSSQSPLNSSAPKPILKSFSKPEPSQPACKRVRFSLEGKENNKTTNDFSTLVKKPGTVLTKQKIVLPMNMNQIRTGGHHMKIVSEVLKKYPNLTKRDNVKLKVVSKIPAAVPPTVQHAVEGDATSGNKSTTSHVSYIYLMNENPNQIGNFQLVPCDKEKEFDVENRTGPWACNSCDSSQPIQFDSYYNYRRHLVEVHELKIDARICEYCGLKSSKRNHLLYHLYTKHNIDPPANVSFPKCSECDYIALSDALLIKHKSVHETKELMTCYVCNVVFRSFSSMHIHMQSTWHKKRAADVAVPVSDYPCPFCEVQFANGKDLKNHIEENHQSQRASAREGKQIYRCPYCEALFADGDRLGKHIVSTHWGKTNQPTDQGEDGMVKQSGQEWRYAEENVQQVQVNSTGAGGDGQESSDMESLNSVASGIVTSLNLVGNEQTVVYYEQQAGHQDIGREATVMTGEECKDFIIPGTVEKMESGSEFQGAEQSDDTVSVENEDSNSRTSNVEEVNPGSCSDHDYSEPQLDENIRQVIPLQQVTSENFQGTPIIQQIVPEQQLVFTTQPSVVFQPSRISLPQRVLLTSGNMVLSQISHPGQNVILPRVIPQARIILSNQIIQQSANILPESGNTIVFTKSEIQPQDIEAVDGLSYASVEGGAGQAKEQDGKSEVVVMEEHPEIVMDEQNTMVNLTEDPAAAAEEEVVEPEERTLALNELMKATEEVVEPEERTLALNELMKATERKIQQVEVQVQVGVQEQVQEQGQEQERVQEQEREQEHESQRQVQPPQSEEQHQEENEHEQEQEEDDGADASSILNNRARQKPIVVRGESAKIVDDWDETNDNSQNVESRSDGPSRPEFF